MVTTARFKNIITSEDDLREQLGWPSERARGKTIAALDQHCRDIIAASPFALVATTNSDGSVDVSPKGDPAGFIRVLDDNTLVIPDRPGNRRFDGLANILTNPGIGMIFIVPGMRETLRVNGTATIVRDQELLESLAMDGKLPWLAIVVDVKEAFVHCPKAFLRSKLWDAETWPDRDSLPSMACILNDHALAGRGNVEEIEADLKERHRTQLY
ncbi:MAG: pyridoxamine 5'-phosphate oxidase family protein [Chloroflexi bacterium]|nr:pyridoxamine 5'-phosphate oxidase family protein [Chloroflexota bacterium]MCH8236281.1 pyridoxamine 5'-phosphate oxidase family protein [Chloroflexota bacterium]